MLLRHECPGCAQRVAFCSPLVRRYFAACSPVFRRYFAGISPVAPFRDPASDSANCPITRGFPAKNRASGTGSGYRLRKISGLHCRDCYYRIAMPVRRHASHHSSARRKTVQIFGICLPIRKKSVHLHKLLYSVEEISAFRYTEKPLQSI